MKETNSFQLEHFNAPLSTLAQHNPISVSKDSTLKESVHLLQDKNIGSLLVIENKEIIGIVTERDFLMKVTGIHENLDKVFISEVMTHHPTCLKDSDPIKLAMFHMHRNRFRHIPLVHEDGTPFNIISIKDILDYLFQYIPEEFITLEEVDELPDHF
jgi:signal-transduction protein with cAMP-binding, CBS, and nucleotidyltransferase domain